jgi:hypothetical protein
MNAIQMNAIGKKYGRKTYLKEGLSTTTTALM